jgi:hypothetical protein
MGTHNELTLVLAERVDIQQRLESVAGSAPCRRGFAHGFARTAIRGIPTHTQIGHPENGRTRGSDMGRDYALAARRHAPVSDRPTPVRR